MFVMLVVFPNARRHFLFLFLFHFYFLFIIIFLLGWDGPLAYFVGGLYLFSMADCLFYGLFNDCLPPSTLRDNVWG